MPWQPVSGMSWVRFGTDPSNAQSPGGIVKQYTAAAQLLVGDVVYISADNSVNKSTVAANHSLRAGIVVGGTATGMQCNDDSANVGAIAAAATDQVLVLVDGIAWVQTDAAIAVGVPIAPSTTVAGKVRPAVVPSVNAGGTAVTSTAANGAIIGGDSQTKIVGKMIRATGAAATGLAAIFLA